MAYRGREIRPDDSSDAESVPRQRSKSRGKGGVPTERSEVFDTIATVFGQYARGGGATKQRENVVYDDEPAPQPQPSVDYGRQWQSDRDKLEQQLLEQEARTATEAKRRAQLENALAAAQHEAAALRDENDRLQSAYADSTARLEDSVRALEARAGHNQAAEDAVAAAQGQAQQLQAQMQDMQAQAQAQLQAMASERDETAARLRQAEESLLLAAQQSGAHAAQLQARAHEAAAREQHFQSQIKALEQGLQAQRQHASQLDTALQAARAEITRLQPLAGRASEFATKYTHMKHDNARLLALLKATAEYQRFVRTGFPNVGGQHGDATGQAPYHSSTYVGGLPRPGGESSARFLGGIHPADNVNQANNPTTIAAQAAEPDWNEQDGLPERERWDELPRLEEEYGPLAQGLFDDGTASQQGSTAGPLVQPMSTARSRRHGSTIPGPRSSGVYVADVLDDYSGGKLSDGTAVDAMLEVQHWIPADAAALAARFRRKYLQQIPAETVAAFLLGLNVVWLKRVDSVLADGTAKLRKQVKELRATLARKEPYREVMQASTINRMYSEISALRQAVGKTAGRPANTAIALAGDRHPDPVFFGTTVPNGDITARVMAETFRASRTKHGSRSGSPTRNAGQTDELHDAVAALTGTTGVDPGTLGAAMLSVPGSGAKRYDAQQSAQLLQSALEAVDALTGRLERSEGNVNRLKEVLRNKGVGADEIKTLLQEETARGRAWSPSRAGSAHTPSRTTQPWRRSPPPRYPVTPRPGSPSSRRTPVRATAAALPSSYSDGLGGSPHSSPGSPGQANGETAPWDVPIAAPPAVVAVQPPPVPFRPGTPGYGQQQYGQEQYGQGSQAATAPVTPNRTTGLGLGASMLSPIGLRQQQDQPAALFSPGPTGGSYPTAPHTVAASPHRPQTPTAATPGGYGYGHGDPMPAATPAPVPGGMRAPSPGLGMGQGNGQAGMGIPYSYSSATQATGPVARPITSAGAIPYATAMSPAPEIHVHLHGMDGGVTSSVTGQGVTGGPSGPGAMPVAPPVPGYGGPVRAYPGALTPSRRGSGSVAGGHLQGGGSLGPTPPPGQARRLSVSDAVKAALGSAYVVARAGLPTN